MWFIGVEVEQETSAPPPKKNPGSAPASRFENNEVVSQGIGVKVKRHRLLIRTSKSLPRSGRLGQNQDSF